MLTFLIVITILSILVLIVGVVSETDDLILSSVILLFLIGFLGWGLCANVISQRSEYFEVKSSKPAVVLNDNSFIVFYIDQFGAEQFQRFYSLSDLPIKDGKVFQMQRDFNMYGSQTGIDRIVGVVDLDDKTKARVQDKIEN